MGDFRMIMITRICKKCGKAFLVKPHIVKRGHGIYCSHSCATSGETNPSFKGGKIKLVCEICHKEFYTHKAWTKKPGTGRFCSRSCRGINRVIHSTRKNTTIEIMVEQELTRRGIVFKKQYPIYQARTIPDFFIPPNICVYCDGDYWHNREEAVIRDSQQNITLRLMGNKVYRFWEKDIKADVSKCVDTINIG